MTEKQSKFKDFKLSTWSITNNKTVYLIITIIVLAGFSAYVSMPRESFPEIQVPNIYVGTAYPGSSAKVVEDKITRILEKEINSIKGIDNLKSTSVLGYSTIVVEFDFSVTSTEALRKVKDKVDIAKSKTEFPKDLPIPPNIFEISPSEFPILYVNLSGDFDKKDLRDYAEYLKDEIKKLPEIDRVDLRGVQDKEVRIEIDKVKAEARNISFFDIEKAIAEENFTMSGGELLLNNYRRTVRIDGEFKDFKEIENLIIKNQDLNIVYLRDVAKVTFQEKEAESYAREHGNPVVMLDVIKKSGENIIIASDKINELIALAKEDVFPSNLEISITNDQSEQIRDTVSNLENSIIFGVILVVLVLLFFLGLRNALFVGIAIPLSMFLSFIILDTIGYTLNMMVLFSLVLALGMLVDNGIVVVENVYRLMAEGMSRKKAAINGVGEIAMPIIASTATTLAAFLPLAIWPGIMGEFMKYLPITLIIVLSSSLFVALVINSTLTSVLMKVEDVKPNKKRGLYISVPFMIIGTMLIFADMILGGMLLLVSGVLYFLYVFFLYDFSQFFQNRLLPVLEKTYENGLRFALKGKNIYFFFFGTFGLLVFSFVLMGIFPPKTEFFPINQPAYLNVFIKTPIGSDIEVTNRTTKEVESLLDDYFVKYNDTTVVNGQEEIHNFMIKSVIAQVGEGTSDPQEGPSFAATPNKARITVSFIETKYRKGLNTTDIMHDVRELLKGKFSADVQIIVDKNPAGPPMDPPINIEITGRNNSYDQVIAMSERMKYYIEDLNIKGIEKLKINIETGKPELPIVIDREKARMLNLSTQQIALTIRTALFGKEVAKYKEGKDDYEINIRYNEKYRYNLDELLTQKIVYRDQNSGKIHEIPISAVVKEVKPISTYSAVKRLNEIPMVTIVSNIIDGYNANEIVAEIKSGLANYEIDQGYEWKFTGQQEDQAKEMAFLSNALMIALFLIFLILVSQFNSITNPTLILTAVVLSLIGVLYGLIIFQMDFIVIMTMIGIISLAGVVVNNAIVLIDYTNLLIDRRKVDLNLDEDEHLELEEVRELVILGGKTRLRPVLLTAITTVLGLFPMAIGLNINFVSFFTKLDPEIYFGGDNAIFFGPMSWTIIFGLTFATFLTLIIVPVMYLLMRRAEYRVRRVLKK
jgi:multidrug efflux pump subunit AcrB